MPDAIWLDHPIRYRPTTVDGPTLRRVLGYPRGVDTRGVIPKEWEVKRPALRQFGWVRRMMARRGAGR